MITLYFLLTLMLLSAVIWLTIPFAKNQAIFSKKFLTLIFIFIFCATLLYQLSGNSYALHQWLATGEKHYQLQTEVAQLGGIDGIIARVKQKLQNHPDDAKGWMILGKLYLFENKTEKAKEAFQKADALKK